MSSLYDLIIIGAGGSGMSAAIYAGRAKLKTLVIERDRVGGQIRITSEVDNYPGIPQTSGEALSQAMRRQAESFGASFLQALVKGVDFSGEVKRVHTTEGDYEALAVIIATGAQPRMIGFKGEEEFRGRGIGYCATCDGEFFTDRDVFVVGGGLAATEEALFLTRYARKVTLIVRGEKLKVPRRVEDRLRAHPGIEVHFNTELIEAGGEGALRFAIFRNSSTGETWRYETPSPSESFGVFVFAGYAPQSSEYAEALKLDEQGYIVTDEGMRTSVEGVYAVGDVRPKELRQLVTAVADGALAATNAEKYVEKAREKLGLPELAEEHESAAAGAGASGAAGVPGAAAGAPGAAADAAAPTAAAPAPAAASAPAPVPSAPPAAPAPAPAPAGDTCALESDDASDADASASRSLGAAPPAAPPAPAPRFFDEELIGQIVPVLEGFQNEVGITAVFDSADATPLDREVRAFLSEFALLTSKVKVTFLRKGADPKREEELGLSFLPGFALTDREGHALGVRFYGVPVGHEINSFILALYNAAGPGQSIDETLAARLAAHTRPVNIKVGVSLSCTLCPDVVTTTQLMALRNAHITAEMIDVMRFPAFKERWGIMSVPAVVIDDERIAFGKKNPEELLDLIA
ncbi:MAG: FAD-dependent oxidoreductase [Coriobacteriales bacterium]|jgi:thioredoxin reductase (NADPH)|nr:FAD-dependent oxidoreductase [Coriobacteriales bacterium]